MTGWQTAQYLRLPALHPALVLLLQHHWSQEHGGHMSAITFFTHVLLQIWLLKFLYLNMAPN